jgi:hypothetical protein
MNVVVESRGRLVSATLYGSDRQRLAIVKLRLPGGGNPNAFLSSFYVFPRLEKAPGREQYKGLGKYLMCAVITKLVADGTLTPKTILELQASGGTVPDGFTSSESEESLDAFLAPYPSALADLKHDVVTLSKRTITREDKARLAESIRQNHRLVAYYTAYGFRVVADYGESANMSGTIDGILSACKSGGKRKTRRRRTLRR